jgi:FixJ family two-component response regulator
MDHSEHSVMVLDDDRSVLNSLDRLLSAHGYRVSLYGEAEDLFRCGPPSVPSCLILDNQLNHGMTGLKVHAELQRRGWDIPTVFLTAHWNVQSVVKAMRAGADGFLTKPFDPNELIDAVSQALERANERHDGKIQELNAKARVATLTTREIEVVRLVVKGLINKEIADQLNLAVVTVKVHRGRAMRKLAAGSAAELARIAMLADLL